MNELTTFLFREQTVDGYPVLVAGICPLIFREQVEIQTKDKIIGFKFDLVNNPYYLDYVLASYARSISHECLYALGISINVSGLQGPTGGIIGNPFSEISSAEGISEYIGNGLSMASYPGGPGIVISGEPPTAEEILHFAKPEDGRINTLLKMAELVVKNNIKIAIIINDGTGTSYPGVVVAIEHGSIRYLSTAR